MEEFSQRNNVSVKAPLFYKINVKYGVNAKQLLTGFVVLVCGAFFYYCFRSQEYTYFLSLLGSYSPPQRTLLPPLFTIGNSLPTFIHVFAFISMTAGFLASQKRGYLFICLAWLTIDVLFELGQGFGNTIILYIPDWFSDVLFLENTKDYLLHGRFDYLDLISIVVGSSVAYFFLMKTKQEKEETA